MCLNAVSVGPRFVFLPFSCSLTVGFLEGIVFRYGYTIHFTSFADPCFIVSFSRCLDFLPILLYLCRTVACPTNSSAWLLLFSSTTRLSCVSLFKWWCAPQVARVNRKPWTATFLPGHCFFLSSECLCSYFFSFIYAVFVDFLQNKTGRKAGFKINTLRPSLKEDHVRHVPLLIVTLSFLPFISFFSEDG